MILHDAEIEKLAGFGQLIETGFVSEGLTPNGYDLRVNEISVGSVTPVSSAEIPSLAWFAVSTMEKLHLPRNICAQLWIRSSYARRGIIASFGKVDAGFRGSLTLSAFNASAVPLTLTQGDRFAQIVFEKLDGDAEMDYGKRSGNYQNQEGVTFKPKS
ncbi:MAG: dCTP deaminase [Methanomassiliicoccales archaeon]